MIKIIWCIQFYTQFFTEGATQLSIHMVFQSEICCFSERVNASYQAQLWQQWQAKTVQQLADTSAQVVSTLDSTLEKHKALELIVSKVHDM